MSEEVKKNCNFALPGDLYSESPQSGSAAGLNCALQTAVLSDAGCLQNKKETLYAFLSTGKR